MNSMRQAIAAAAVAPARQETMSGQQSFCFKSDFLGFSGHFPDYPILPAVLQVLIAHMLAETIMGVPLSVMALNRAKFVQQVRPNDQVDVQVTCREKEGELHCASELMVAAQRVASFSLVLKRD